MSGSVLEKGYFQKSYQKKILYKIMYAKKIWYYYQKKMAI